jgi:hypothetical protein
MALVADGAEVMQAIYMASRHVGVNVTSPSTPAPTIAGFATGMEGRCMVSGIDLGALLRLN